jgi:alanyl-tRNA synthetase
LGKGYVLRRLIRRSLRYQRILDIDGNNVNFLEQLARTIVENYAKAYPEMGRNFNYILEELKSEQARFEETLEKGMKEWEKIAQKGRISGEEAFKLFATYGFPLELTEEFAQENKITVDKKGFQKAFEEHQKISRNGSDQRFKGGLIDSSYETTKLHTATHLMQAALRAVLGTEVFQRGSNINPKRLRFDFSYPEKLTQEELAKVEEMVNNAIKSGLEVSESEMKYEQAVQKGAIGVFEKKYGEKVKVYTVGNPDQPFSREICGGPHVKNTQELGRFKIVKEESVSAGVRRIKAILE